MSVSTRSASQLAPLLGAAFSGEFHAHVLDAFSWGRLDEPGPQTESSIERGFRPRGPVDDEWGRSESVDPDNVGDIADEGTGHRG